MRPPLNLEGQRYGHWIILSLDATHPKRRWLCHCDCGVERSVDQADLRGGKSRSCGCSATEIHQRRPHEERDIPPETLAYCAGLFDGEGWITLRRLKAQEVSEGHRRSTAYILVTGIGMVNKPVILFLQETFGVGWIEHRPPAGKNKRTQWRWMTSTYDAIFVLTALLPYLHVKREEALVALAFAEANQRNTFSRRPVDEATLATRAALYEQLRALKHLEWVE